MRVRTIALSFCLGQILSGCDSSEEDLPDHLDFDLPEMKCTFSTADAFVASALKGHVPNMVCAGPLALGSDCCAPPAPLTAADCLTHPVACDQVSNYCALMLELNQPWKVDLSKVPAIAAVRGYVFSSVNLGRLSTSLATFSVSPHAPEALPIRGADLYVGPQDIDRPSSQRTAYLAPVGLSAGTTNVVPGPEAQQAFSAFARDYLSPFSILLSVRVVITAESKAKMDAWLAAPVSPRRESSDLDESLAFTVTGQATARH